ncbi:MAG TPA: helix-turn-helix domain-containing protein [Candidatus Bathyarchaeia archaeon]
MDSIQLLTRKNATCQDLLSCLYNLKPIDLEVFLQVARNENATLDQIAQLVQRDRSSTHRVLAKLTSAGLIHKKTRNLRSGGYYHIYSIAELSKIKEQARQKVKEITEGLENLIDRFDSDLKKHYETHNFHSERIENKGKKP